MSDEKSRTQVELEHAATITAAYLSKNHLPVSEIPGLIRNVHAALTGIASPSVDQAAVRPFVSIKKSVTPDHIVCLEDGKKLTMLKRYIRSRYNLSPEQYREKWNLPRDYPMVAPNYAKLRSEFAKTIGLGTTKNKKKIPGRKTRS